MNDDDNDDAYNYVVQLLNAEPQQLITEHQHQNAETSAKTPTQRTISWHSNYLLAMQNNLILFLSVSGSK